jgi:putative restriction endonuclease
MEYDINYHQPVKSLKITALKRLMHMEEQLQHYIKSFGQLRTDSGKTKYPESTLHRAPHKPLLLLTVLDLAAQGNLTTNLIPLTPELGDVFASYWKLVMPPDRAGNLSLPFFHLKNDGFWYLIPQHGKEEALGAIRQIAGMSQLRDTVIGAQLDDDLYQLICIEENRNLLRTVLIEGYFHQAVHERLLEQAEVNLMAFQYSQKLLAKAQTQSIAVSTDGTEEQKGAVRDQGFRRAVLTAYNHRCVLCGVRLLTEDGLTAATAAHIVPWSVSYNDDPRNGLCLCRLCHWVFDVGLAGITTKYRITLSKQLTSVGNMAGYLTTLESRPIFEPVEPFFNPDAEALEWHLGQVFLS